MITLAIETSCDETAVCLLKTEAVDGQLQYAILGNIIHSQIELHRQYGGVFPVMAKREHSKNLVPLLEELIKKSGIKIESYTPSDLNEINFLKEKESDLLARLLASDLIKNKPVIDQIAVTRGPGLEPALWVGVNCAQALGKIWGVSVIGVNHMEGHILGSFLESGGVESNIKSDYPSKSVQKVDTFTGVTKKEIANSLVGTALRPVAFPALALLVSGGHTELVLVKKIGDYEVIGRTKDDAVGEAFDKVARMLDLPYPGGVEISRLAEKARGEKPTLPTPRPITLPRPMIHSHDLNFSFSGLKTAVLYIIYGSRDGKINTTEKISNETRADIAREFEDAVTDVLAAKTEKAIEKYADDATPIQSLIVGGGVSANKHICAALQKVAEKYSIPVYLPPAGVSGDNALMIALVASLNPTTNPISARGNLML